jgi:parallel beta-helix repeat protein
MRCLRRTPALTALALCASLVGCGSSSSATPQAVSASGGLGLTVRASGSEATSAVASCRVDGATWKACDSPFAAFDLTPGPHTVEIEASHGGVRVLRRPAPSTGDRVALVAFAQTASGRARARVSFTVAGAPPSGSVALSGVAAGARLRGLANVSSRIRSGSSRTVLVDYYVDQQIVATAASAPWGATIDASRLTAGVHSLRAVATSLDRRRVASAPRSVRVAMSRVAVRDVASVGDLQHAIDALGDGGGTLRLPAGRFSISDLRVGGGVRLIGAGADKTVLVAPAGAYDVALDVTGHDVLISDLTIDASGTGATSDTSAAIYVHDAEDVVLRRLSLVHLRGYGVHVADHHARISLQQSTLDGDGRARSGLVEWAADATSGDVSVERCVIRNMREYGMAFQSYLGGRTWPDRRALAYGNDVDEIHDPTIHDGTIEIGIWATGIGPAVLDNVVRHTGWDGIETVVNATNAVIAGNVVRGTRTGIYAENVTRDTLIEQNDIADVSVAGINLEPPHTGPRSGRMTIRQNRIVGAGEFGIGIGQGTFGNRITGNEVLDTGNMAILLEGASGNVVEGNDLRDRRKQPHQVWCVYDPQSAASKTTNQVDGNDCTGSRHGGANDLTRLSARRGATS